MDAAPGAPTPTHTEPFDALGTFTNARFARVVPLEKFTFDHVPDDDPAPYTFKYPAFCASTAATFSHTPSSRSLGSPFPVPSRLAYTLTQRSWPCWTRPPDDRLSRRRPPVPSAGSVLPYLNVSFGVSDVAEHVDDHTYRARWCDVQFDLAVASEADDLELRFRFAVHPVRRGGGWG